MKTLGRIYVLAFALAVAGSSTVFAQVSSPCLPTNDLPGSFDAYSAWNTEDRDGYTLFAPPWYFNSSLMREGYLYPNFDDYDTRADLYREAFVVALLQGELMARLNDDQQARARIQILAEQTGSQAGLSAQLVTLLQAISSGNLYEVDPGSIEATVNEWSEHVNSEVLSQRLNLLGASLSTFGLGLKLYGDALQHTFYHSLATANTIERMAALDTYFQMFPPADDAMGEGYDLAKDEVNEFLNSDTDLLKGALQSVIDEPGYYAVSGTQLALKWVVAIKASSLSASTLLGAAAAGGIMTGVIALIQFASDMEDYRIICAEAAVDSWLRGAVDSYLWPDVVGTDCESVRRLYFQSMMMRCALSYSSYKLHDELLAFRWRLVDIGQLLGDLVSLQYDDIQTFRNEVLDAYMNSIATRAMEYQNVFDWLLEQSPMIVSYRTSATNPPSVTIVFDRDMDANSFSPSCVSVVGTSSGSHDPSSDFDHENYVLSLAPTGAFEYEEEVVVTLESCVQSIDGIQFDGPYELSFIIEPEPQLLIATWSGRNGVISPDIYAGIGDDVTVTATPDPGYQVHKWYQDGLTVPEVGISYTLNDIQTSHSVGVTFQELVIAEITVTSPNGGELFARDSRMPITWSWKGEIGDEVKIELLSGGSLNEVVAAPTFNDGSYVWDVPFVADIGTNFTIRVSSVESASILDESNETFEITTEVIVPDWIEIYTIQDLQAVGSDAAHPHDAQYIVMNDVNASGFAFQPIGTGAANYFRGVLDGNGYTVSRLDIELPGSNNVGLFSIIESGGLVENLTLTDLYIEGNENVGTFAGGNEGSMINCHATSTNESSWIEGVLYVGGIVGDNYGLVRNCTVLRTTNNFEVISTDSYVGGVVGVNGQGSGTVAVIEFCKADCYVECDDDYIGGIAGWNFDIIRECAYEGSQINGSSWGNGGVVGWNQGGQVINSYWNGIDLGGNTFVGGVIGWFEGGAIDSCYAAGPISANPKGGLAGRCGGTIANSFWDSQLTGCSNACGDGSATIINSHGETTAEMKKLATFTTKYGTNWNFDNVWAIDDGVDYPRLRGVGSRLPTPTGLSASIDQSDGVHVSWDPVSYTLAGGTHAAVLTVLRSNEADEDAVKAELSSWQQGDSFVDETAQPDETYFYWIKAAATISGARESELAGPISGSRTHPPAPSPTDVSSSQGFVQSVLVEWEATDANYYRVYRTPVTAMRAGLQGEVLKLTSDTVSEWQRSMKCVDIPPESEEKYLYSIASALDSNGLAASLLSVSDTGSFAVADTGAPVINLSIIPIHPILSQSVLAELAVQDNGIIDEVQLHWESVGDSTVTWQVDDTSYYETTHLLGSFNAGDTLHVWVSAIDSAGNEGESEHIVAVILEESVVAPSQPVGEGALLTGETSLFTAEGATSNLGVGVEYRFDWGDSTFTSWGDSTASKNWAVEGLYPIRAQARSMAHPERESPWSDPLPVCVDSQPPVVTFSTNSGEDLDFGADTIIVAGEAIEQLPGSGIDSVYSLSGSHNEGNNGSWGFKIPLAPIGQATEIVVAARDRAGNTGTDTIRVTRVVPDYTISGMAFYLESDSLDTCSVWDDVNQMWRTAIPDLTVRLYYLWTKDIAVESNTDSCGNYGIAVPRGNYWLGVAGVYYDSALYQFDEVYFDTVSNTNIIGKNIFFPYGPQGMPTDVTEDESRVLPDMYRLSQNYPNPFNPSTKIEFDLAKSGVVKLTVYNLLGKRVRTLFSGHLSSGRKSVIWDGRDEKGRPLASGIYFYRIKTGDFTDTKKMVLLK